jgi:LmbE family N-acetylglucosaminyl deacetylase
LAGVTCVYTFGADFPGHPRKRSANRGDTADFVVDIEKAFKLKLAAMECHRTQNALFVRRPSAEAGRPVPLREAVLRMESFHRALWDRSMEKTACDIVPMLDDVLRR